MASFSRTSSDVYGVASTCLLASETIDERFSSAFFDASSDSTSREAQSLGK
jgi:hypothetical protein